MHQDLLHQGTCPHKNSMHLQVFMATIVQALVAVYVSKIAWQILSIAHKQQAEKSGTTRSSHRGLVIDSHKGLRSEQPHRLGK